MEIAWEKVSVSGYADNVWAQQKTETKQTTLLLLSPVSQMDTISQHLLF